MLERIEVLYIGRDEEFEGGRTFERIGNLMSSFAGSIQRVVIEKFPQVVGMNEEDYKDISMDVEKYIHSEEAYNRNKEIQLEALAAIATESLTTMFQLTEGSEEEVKKAFNRFITNEIDKIKPKKA